MLLVSEAQQHTAEEVIRGLREMWRGNGNDKKMLFFAPPRHSMPKRFAKLWKAFIIFFPLFRHSFFHRHLSSTHGVTPSRITITLKQQTLANKFFHLIPNRDAQAQSTGCHFRIMKIISLGFLPSSLGHLNASSMQNDNNDGLLEEVRFHFSILTFNKAHPTRAYDVSQQMLEIGKFLGKWFEIILFRLFKGLFPRRGKPWNEIFPKNFPSATIAEKKSGGRTRRLLDFRRHHRRR